MALLVAAPGSGGFAAAATSAASSTTAMTAGATRVVIAPKPAVPGGAVSQGAVPSTRMLAGAVALKPRNPAALQAFATAVSTPASSRYGRYLAPGAFASAFGPSTAAIAAVEHQLVAAGVGVTSVSSNGLLVNFRAPAARVAAAFGTHLVQYRLTGGRVAFSTNSALTLPAAVAGSVQAVLGLSDVLQAHSSAVASQSPRRGGVGHARAAAPPVTSAPKGSPVACSDATATAQQFGGLTDTQIADAYGAKGLYSAGDTGQGQTIAIFELEPYSTQDIATFDSCYFGRSAASSMVKRLSTTAVDGGQQIGTGSGEAALDIDDISAVAPGAKLDVYEAPNNLLGTIDNYSAMIGSDTAKVISTSWGFCEQPSLEAYPPGSLQLENTLFEQAAAQGQSVFAASGDAGSDDCAEQGLNPVAPDLSVDDPASQPFVTGAGGTTITDATQPPAEQVWNDGPAGGADGGGQSDLWTQPAWQAASTVPGIKDTSVLAAADKASGTTFCEASSTIRAASTGCREVPDVSAQADEFTGAITVYFAGSWYTFGGTSSAAPLWAAMIADVNASTACRTNPATATGVGFANPSLYALASVPSEYAASFTDVTTGNNDAYGIDGLYPATTGYDMASGLGSPELTSPSGGHGLAYYLCSAAAATRPAVTAISPRAVDAPQTIKVLGSGFETSGGASLVTGVQIGAIGVAAHAVDVVSATEIDVDLAALPLGSGAGGADFLGDGNGSYEVSVSLVGGLTSPPTPASRLTVYGVQPNTPGGSPEVDGVGPSGGSDAGGNTVTVYGSGFTGATAVTFGGVAAPIARIVDDSQIVVTVPAFKAANGGTTCAHATVAADDVCQTTVRVTNAHGTSPVGRILAPYSGTYALNAAFVPITPAGCECEIAPAATEYDYLPSPTITSVTSRPVGANGIHYADEDGGTIETINGTGLGILGFEWLDFGPANLATSADTTFTYVSGTRIKVVLPGIAPTTSVVPATIAVQTLASPNSGDLASTIEPSTTARVLFAPKPTITSISTASGFAAGPSSGGTTVTIRGIGFTAANHVKFDDERPGGYAGGVTYAIRVLSNTEMRVTTPSTNPGTDHLLVCGPSGCSPRDRKIDTYIFYPPGAPRLTSISPRTGPSAGQTVVTLHGANLGYTVAVYFGSKLAKILPAASLLDSGSTSTVLVKAPPGPTGRTVDVRVVTVESAVTGSGRSPVTAAATYRYKK